MTEPSIYIGIDLGGTSIKMGLVDQQGHLIDWTEAPTRAREGYHKVSETMHAMAGNLLHHHGYAWHDCVGVGIGVPGFLDLPNGIIVESVNLGWKNIDLKKHLAQTWRVPVELDNDANVAALGEMWCGAGRDISDMLCLTIGTGIGGGVIINRDIYHGANGMAGEIGHVRVKERNARTCNCGRKGCLETEASATAIEQNALERAQQQPAGKLKEIYESSGTITAKQVIELARQGDADSRQIIEDVGQVLGRFLAEMSYLLNPELIVVGGGVSHAEDVLFQPLITTFKASALPRLTEKTSVVRAQLGNRAGMIGAAWLIHRKHTESSLRGRMNP
ncbi:MAG: ROK family glucokinase [Bacillaceae bacterium]|nr:ROK family glucokinase [Bacillaceae bacterium]